MLFSDAIPDTLGHSDMIGKIKAANGDRDRIVVDAADDAFMHTPLPAAGAFAYLPPLPSAEGLAYRSNSCSPWSTCARTAPS